MGAFIAKQPNGLYCRFSSIVDTVTEYNMTEDEYVKMRMEEAREDALNTLKHYVRPFEMVIQNFEPVNHTRKEFNALLKEMGYVKPKK